MKQRPWFNRRFPFPIDVAAAPELMARLVGTPARLEELVRGASARALVAQRDGTWSAQENVGHLLDLEPLWLGRLEDFLNGAVELRAADLRNRRTHEADHNVAASEDLLRDFRVARGKLTDKVRTLSDDDWTRTARHPRLQEPMTVADHAFFVAEHDDNHLARIAELLSPG